MTNICQVYNAIFCYYYNFISIHFRPCIMFRAARKYCTNCKNLWLAMQWLQVLLCMPWYCKWGLLMFVKHVVFQYRIFREKYCVSNSRCSLLQVNPLTLTTKDLGQNRRPNAGKLPNFLRSNFRKLIFSHCANSSNFVVRLLLTLSFIIIFLCCGALYAVLSECQKQSTWLVTVLK